MLRDKGCKALEKLENIKRLRDSGLVAVIRRPDPAKINQIADALVKDGKIKRGYLGIRSQTVDIPADAKKSLKREQKAGLLIVGMETDSPAGKGGLMVGDILVGIAGEAIAHHDELFTRLSGNVVGKSTALDVLRGGKLQTVNVIVGER
jgi:S1-C subfamily serine protease